MDPNKHHYYLPLPHSHTQTKTQTQTQTHLDNHDCKTTITSDSIPSSSSSSSPPTSSNWINKYALAGAILASTNSVLLGYDIGVMSGAVLFIREDLRLSSPEIEVLVGSLNVCSLVGSLAAGHASDRLGRRRTILLAAATFLAGAVLMGLAPSFLLLLAGRLVAGVGVGVSLMIAPVYVAEISPTLRRGFLTSLPEVFINVGILLGYISNYLLSGLSQSINWRIMLGAAAAPAIAVAAGVLLLPESPRWLAMRGRVNEARKVLIKISASKDEAEARLSEIVKAASFSSSSCDGRGVWQEMLFKPSRSLRRALIAAIGVNFFMQASGNDAVVYYSPEVFKEAGIERKRDLVGVTIIMGIVKTTFVLVSALFLDSFGRRPLLLLGSAGMALSLAGLGFGSKFLDRCDPKPEWAIVVCVVAVCSAVSFFSIGLGPITWVYSSEVFPSRFRAQGSSLAISVNRLVSGLVSMSFLSVSEVISFGGTFWVLSGIMVLGTAFFYLYLPETKGKSLEEIVALFEDREQEVTLESSSQSQSERNKLLS